MQGVTWSAPVPLTAHPPPPFSKTVRPAVGHGIEVWKSAH